MSDLASLGFPSLGFVSEPTRGAEFGRDKVVLNRDGEDFNRLEITLCLPPEIESFAME